MIEEWFFLVPYKRVGKNNPKSQLVSEEKKTSPRGDGRFQPMREDEQNNEEWESETVHWWSVCVGKDWKSYHPPLPSHNCPQLQQKF